MPAEIKPGSVLTKEGIALPESVHIEPFMPGWNLVSDADAAQTQRKLEQAGWHFVQGEEIVRSATARELITAMYRAMQRVGDEAARLNVNAVEVIGFDATKLVFVYEVAARGYGRHIQQPRLAVRQNGKRRIVG